MGPKFLAFLLFGILAFAALDGAELRRERENATPAASPAIAAPEVTAMDGGNGYPPGAPPKAF
jgi:hypothetical protein